MKYAIDQLRILIAERMLSVAFSICPDESPEKTDFAMAMVYVFGKAQERCRPSCRGKETFKSVRGNSAPVGVE